MRAINVADIAACLRSVVGASKVLHFVNDAVFPIWDSNIEGFRLDGEPTYNHMRQVNNYFDYADNVHAIREDPAFPAFFTEIVVAFNGKRPPEHRLTHSPEFCCGIGDVGAHWALTAMLRRLERRAAAPSPMAPA